MRYSTWKWRPSRRNADSRRVRPCLESLEDRTLLSGLTTFVYTESNDSNGNAVLAFQQGANGTLTEIGSFSTGGYGFRNISPLLGPNDSSFEVVATPDNRFLFAVNQGSSSVSAFSINSNGGLTLVGTFNSLGVQPDSLAVSGNHLYVTNRGDSAFNTGNGTAYPSDDVPNITVFNIGGNGALTPIPGSTVTFNEQSSPSHSLITPDGKLLFVDNFATPAGATQAQGGNTMIPFQIQANGTLVEGTPVGSSAPTPLLLGAVLNPDARIIYAGLALDNEIAVFSYDASGNITYDGLGNNMALITGTTPCWAAVSADGKFLYTGDSNSDSVGVFSLADPTNPVQIQEFSLGGPGSTLNPPLKVRAFQVALSSDGKTLYAISAANTAGTSTAPLFPDGNQVHALTVDTTTGLLTEPTGPVLLDAFGVPGDAAPQGAAVVTVDVTWAVADFTGQGVYRFLNTGGAPTGSDWTLLTMADAAEVAVAANGDVVAVFAPGGRGVNAAGVGVWRYEDSTGWVKLSAGFADGVSIVDSGAVAATFASGAANVDPDAVGVWRYEDSTTPNWQHLNAVGASSNPPPAIAGIHASIVGLDDAGDVVGEFPGAGVWLYTSSTNSWQQPAGAPTLDASLLQLTANGILTAEFPGHGIWEITALTATPPTWAAVEISQDVSTLGVNVNNVFTAVFDNPPPNGAGVYRFTPPVTYASLEPLNGVDAAAVAVGASDNIFANFGPAGLYYFDSVSAMISQTFPTGVSPSDPVTVFSVA